MKIITTVCQLLFFKTTLDTKILKNILNSYESKNKSLNMHTTKISST